MSNGIENSNNNEQKEIISSFEDIKKLGIESFIKMIENSYLESDEFQNLSEKDKCEIIVFIHKNDRAILNLESRENKETIDFYNMHNFGIFNDVKKAKRYISPHFTTIIMQNPEMANNILYYHFDDNYDNELIQKAFDFYDSNKENLGEEEERNLVVFLNEHGLFKTQVSLKETVSQILRSIFRKDK